MRDRRKTGGGHEKRCRGEKRRPAVDDLENASCRRCDVLSTLHNIALVVNSMTFEQNAAVSPYDGARRAGGKFFFIRSYISLFLSLSLSCALVLFLSSFLLSRLTSDYI